GSPQCQRHEIVARRVCEGLRLDAAPSVSGEHVVIYYSILTRAIPLVKHKKILYKLIRRTFGGPRSADTGQRRSLSPACSGMHARQSLLRCRWAAPPTGPMEQ